MESKKAVRSILFGGVLAALSAQPSSAQFPPAPGTGPGLPETIEAIDSARVTTRILYITAHPDDESAALLTYLARGLHADVALLTLTRGEGGQNDLGPEQAPQLGLIRTQELLAASRGYGIKLFFGSAPDFGFSKTPEETEKIWGDAVLGEMVRVIRTYRPNIVINGWGGVHGGHGHHQTSGLWTPKAAQMAADPKAFPEQISKDGLAAWGSSVYPLQILDTERGGATGATSNGYSLPVDEISELWGKPWREIALDAFSNHRSQGITGFVNSPFLRRPLVLIREDGAKLDPATLAEPLHELPSEAAPEGTFRRAMREAESSIEKAHGEALALHWAEASLSLVGAARQIDLISPRFEGAPSSQLAFELRRARERIDRALTLAAAVEVRAEADRDTLVVGESFGVSAQAICRSEAGCELGAAELNLPQFLKETKREGDAAKGYQFTVDVAQAAPELTAWEKLQPEPPPLVTVKQEVTIGGYKFSVTVPVTHIAPSSTRVDRVPLRIVPAYTLKVEPKQALEVLGKPGKSFDVLLKVHSYATQPGKVSVWIDLPDGFTASAPVELAFDGAGEKFAKVTVTPPNKLTAGKHTITAYAKRGNEKFSTSIEPLPSLPTQFWSEPAQCEVYALDLSVPKNLRVGYITAEGEPIPEALRTLGLQVEMLDAQALAFGDLSKFNAVVVGVRAYELRPELPGANQRLLQYVSNGGTLVVQYNRDFAWNRAQYGPYPAKIQNGPGGQLPRITDENSPVKFLKPDDPLLNRPNKITQEDFKGWVQERGLYYWTQFDAKYTPLLAMNDPGEPDLNGAIVYTHYGKGIYIYTGIAFFRQIPEGVPGAYRLFVNLLSATETN
ncbi:MAG TPA: PIG-L family deacetylase [Verrucomicrobiae bacterium]|nr:PIG-L family deacetylase [Verrucomicrobiae bacterium]